MLATEEGGRRAPARFGEVKRGAESTKTRERKLGEVARTIGSSAWSLRGQSFGAAEFRARRGSRRRSMARLRRLLDLELGQGGLAELGRYLRPPRRAGQANREDHARPLLKLGQTPAPSRGGRKP